MALDILLTIFLVLLNGFFVAAEFAIVKVRGSQLETNTSKGSRSHRLAVHITEHLEAYLAATQLGITIASLALGWIGENVAERIILSFMDLIGYHPSHELAHQIAMPFAFCFITFLHVVFGELAPKSIAIRYALPTTTFVALPLRIFYIIFIPFIFLFNGFANLLLRAIGIAAAGHEEAHSEEELKLLIAESAKGGSIQPKKVDLLENVFTFDDKTVKQVMIPRTKIFAIDVEDSLEENLDKIMEEGYSRVPVYEKNIDNIVGVLYTKELFKYWRKNKETTDIRKILKDPYFVPSVKKVGDLLQEFQRKYLHIAFITDEFGGTVGLVTMEDVIEELLGEIYDEYDEKNDIVIKISDNEFIANAISTIANINERIPSPLQESRNYETLSGLMLYHLRRIPEINEKVTIDGYELTVLQKSHSRVEIVGMRIISPKK
jgi:CBS domain containing-hemolysin-like protein